MALVIGVDMGGVDPDATHALRDRIRAQRRERSRHDGTAPTPDVTGARWIDDDLARYDGPSTPAGPQITSETETYVDDPLAFGRLCRPGGWTAVYSGVVPAGHPERTARVAALPAGR
ncbi:hypothetical protein [Pseudonocardia xishanensis]|uniref:Uncharacterized protein n=1 Tax=Pseudonocardia xishanensis TaxID=630995 RepID=A0ABP8RV40_9PSEU